MTTPNPGEIISLLHRAAIKMARLDTSERRQLQQQFTALVSQEVLDLEKIRRQAVEYRERVNDRERY